MEPVRSARDSQCKNSQLVCSQSLIFNPNHAKIPFVVQILIQLLIKYSSWKQIFPVYPISEHSGNMHFQFFLTLSSAMKFCSLFRS